LHDREGVIVNLTKILVLVAILGLGIGIPAAAQQATTVLDIAPGVAMLGAGAAGISVANGAETLYYNPATLAALPGISFSSFYASHLGLANYSALALTFRNWGLAALLLDSGGIAGYDTEGTPTGDLSYKNTGILFGVGFDPSSLPFIPDMAFDFSIGARFKYVSVQIAEETGTGFSVDLGFRTTIPDMNLGPMSATDMAFGFTAVNLFGGVNYDVATDDFLMDLKLGASARLAGVFFLALDLHLGGSAQVGIVYSPVPTLDLRVGVISSGTVSLTAGVGVNVEGFLIDYAFVSHQLGGTHRVSLTLDFSSLDIAAISRSMRNILP
jgi:hypothetical protein